MSLVIVGTGMVSPAGLTPHAHACLVWAGALLPTASPFRRKGGERVPVTYCPWLGARLGMGDRLLAMGQAALDTALRPFQGTEATEPPPLFLCSTPDRPGLTSGEHADLERELGRVARARHVKRFEGAAGVFAALHEAEAHLAAGAHAVTILALDSHVGEDALAACLENPPSPWGGIPGPPAEGAAALVVTTATRARRIGLELLGVVHYSSTALGAANDDNDVPADGEAMTRLLHHAPTLRAAAIVFGQSSVDALRQVEWQLAVARNPERFHPEYQIRSIDGELGAVGAAAGAMNLIYGLAVVRHKTTDMPVREIDPFLAWAISRDGTRGLAAVSVKP